MIRTKTKKTLTKVEQARQVKMLTAMELFSSTGVWGLLDVAEVTEDLSVGVTQLLIDKVGE